MRRDWPLVAAGFGIVAIAATLVAIMLLGYEFESGSVPAGCKPPAPPAVRVDGCGPAKQPFDEWIVQPSMIVGFAFALLLLAVAGATIRRGLRSERLRSR
jgi:hypothetical protein